MRINAHCHIFNLRSVFTDETLEILIRRVTEIEMPELIKTKLVELITRAIDSAADYTHVESLVEKFVKETVLNEKLKDFSAGEDLKMEL